MNRLQQLFAAGLLLSASTTFAQSSAQMLSVDQHPKYQKGKNEYRIDKVEYREDATVIHFRYVGHNYSYITLYSPQGDHPWFLRDDATGQEFAMKGVYNVHRNGHLEEAEVQGELEVSAHYYSRRYKMNVTCEVHFEPLPAAVKQVDLIEGQGREDWSNHFNVFNIRLKTPKTAVAETPQEETPAVDQPANALAKKEPMQAMQSELDCTVFPNPSSTVLNVQIADANGAALRLVNTIGQVLWTGMATDNITTIDLRDYPAGAYFLHVEQGNQSAVKTVVIE